MSENTHELSEADKVSEGLVRVALVWGAKEAWIKLIRASMHSDDCATANIIFEMMTSRDVPDDSVIRSLRELSMYYVQPVLMGDRTLEQVKVLISWVEASLRARALNE